MKNIILAGVAFGIAGMALSGCGGGASDTEQAAAPEGFPGITVSDGRLVLPAVKGNPGAVYFNIDYSGNDIAVIRAASVKGSKSAQLHQTAKGAHGESQMQEVLSIKLEKGKTLKFEPGGDHVMAMDLDDTLKPGGNTEVTLTFLGGDKVSFPAKVEAPGSAS